MARRFIVATVVAVCAALTVSVAPASAQDAILKTTLTGAAERPGPGDPDATGSATVYIDDDTDRLCLLMTFANVDGTPSGLHIHLGPPTAPGPVVVPFAVPAPGATSFFQCVSVPNEDLLDNLSVNPSQYYLNLHSTPLYPGGAIRGQLASAF